MSIDQRIREGLRTTNDALPMPDVDGALAAVSADAGRTRLRTLVVGLAAAAAVVAVGVGVVVTRDTDDSQRPVGPPTPTPTPTETVTDTSAPETIPREPSEVLVVHQRADSLDVEVETVPGSWQLTETRRDVWVAIKTDANGATSQWWGKGSTAHPMPPSAGDILRGGVVISQDARWIAWTRPATDVYGMNPPRVMEVVDTTTGEVRWSRNADADAPEMGALAVTNDGVVVFGHCLEPVLDSGGWPQCDDARIDVWVPEIGVTGTVPAEVSAGDSPFPDTVTSLTPLLQRTGAHNGLLVRSAETARPQYLRVTARGDVEVIATLPQDTVAVTADERFALLAAECPDGLLGCGFTVLSVDSGERRAFPSLEDLLSPQVAPYYGYVVERDDLLLVQDPLRGGVAVARCGLAQARCVPLRK